MVSSRHARSYSHSIDDHLVALLARLPDDDGAAFRELHDLTRTWVVQVAQRTLGIPEHAAEVAQEVFLHVWQHADSFDPHRGTVLGWLSMLTHRRSVDRVRAVTRSVARDERNASLGPTEVGDVVSELGLARLEAARVRAALHHIEPRYRDAVVLTFLDGHTHAQAACLLAIPVGTLKTHVRSGLARLREHLGPVAA